MARRFPWKARHIGFVMAHVGVLVVLAGSLVSFHFGITGDVALHEGESTDRVALPEQSLQVVIRGRASRVYPVSFDVHPPRAGHETLFALPVAGLSLVSEEYLPHAEVNEEYRPSSSGHPALHFVLDTRFMKTDGWLSGGDPSTAAVSFGRFTLRLHQVASEAGSRAPVISPPGNEIAFLLAPSGQLAYAIAMTGGLGPRGAVVHGEPLLTPWTDVKLVVDRVFPHAVPQDVVLRTPAPEQADRRRPVVKVRVQGLGVRGPSRWVPWKDVRALTAGELEVRVAFRPPEVRLPFEITLIRSKSDTYPGTTTPATFESRVRVNDPARGIFEHDISMNHPFRYRGYTFFQSSIVEGEPLMSVFSVATSPGLPAVYVGTTLIVGGVAWMFWLAPRLARRHTRAAMVQREREIRHEIASSRRVFPDPQPRTGAHAVEVDPGGG